MLAQARDVMAVLFLENQLGALRDEFLARSIEGNPSDAGEWAAREQAISDEMKRRFYNLETRNLVKPDDAESMNDDEDFEARTQKLSEHAIFMTHHKLAAIPYVGHPEYREA